MIGTVDKAVPEIEMHVRDLTALPGNGIILSLPELELILLMWVAGPQMPHTAPVTWLPDCDDSQ